MTCRLMLYFSVILIILNHSTRSGMSPRENEVTLCKQLKLRKPPGPLVALASFPRSGNSWLRYLLQQSTGILTGSEYCDPELEMNGFPAECVDNGSVLVVKTHGPSEHDLLGIEKFDKAILLIRHPRDALLSGFIYSIAPAAATIHAFRESTPIEKILSNLSAAEYISVGNQKFNPTREWNSFVNNFAMAWGSFNINWLENFYGSLYIVLYDKLVQDISPTLRGIFNFLNVQVSEDDLACTLRHREGIYRSKHEQNDFDPFTPRMYEHINKIRKDVLEAVESVTPSYLRLQLGAPTSFLNINRILGSKEIRNNLVERTMLKMKRKIRKKSFVRSRQNSRQIL